MNLNTSKTFSKPSVLQIFWPDIVVATLSLAVGAWLWLPEISRIIFQLAGGRAGAPMGVPVNVAAACLLAIVTCAGMAVPFLLHVADDKFYLLPMALIGSIMGTLVITFLVCVGVGMATL